MMKTRLTKTLLTTALTLALIMTAALAVPVRSQAASLIFINGMYYVVDDNGVVMFPYLYDGRWSNGAPMDLETYIQMMNGVPLDALREADRRDLKATEAMNNTITNVDGLTSNTIVGQGGGIILNGQKTNITILLDKPDNPYYVSASKQMGGTPLSVVKTSCNGVDLRSGAEVNFTVSGVTTGQNIAVYIYDGDHQWTELPIKSVTDGHVTVTMTKTGILAFIAK